MIKVKVVDIKDDVILFDDGSKLYSYNDGIVYNGHYLCMEDLSLDDFEGLEFDISGCNFFGRVEGYGIELVSLNGWPIRVPGYGENNGYYSHYLELVLESASGVKREYDITECQDY